MELLRQKLYGPGAYIAAHVGGIGLFLVKYTHQQGCRVENGGRRPQPVRAVINGRYESENWCGCVRFIDAAEPGFPVFPYAGVVDVLFAGIHPFQDCLIGRMPFRPVIKPAHLAFACLNRGQIARNEAEQQHHDGQPHRAFHNGQKFAKPAGWRLETERAQGRSAGGK
ncbi:hypothetical protein DO76_1839 [Brucella suis]|nr:hypothetical protein DO76_1839 [Brucella suis]